jgi:hypothetical protein
VAVAEIVLGPLLATLVLIPLLLAAAMGVALSIAATLAESSGSLADRFAGVRSQLPLFLWVGSATLGILALWPAVLRRPEDAGLVARLSLIAGIVVGEMAATRWLWLMEHHRPDYDLQTWAAWLALLLGPMLVGARHAVRLALPPPGDDPRAFDSRELGRRRR